MTATVQTLNDGLHYGASEALGVAGMDLYAVLGVPRSATAEEIKSAYRRGVLDSHPDRHRASPAAERARAEAKFRELAEAYETLNCKAKRSSYDRAGRGAPTGFAGGRGAAYRPYGTTYRTSTARAPFGYEAIFHRWRQAAETPPRGARATNLLGLAGIGGTLFVTLLFTDALVPTVQMGHNGHRRGRPVYPKSSQRGRRTAHHGPPVWTEEAQSMYHAQIREANAKIRSHM